MFRIGIGLLLYQLCKNNKRNIEVIQKEDWKRTKFDQSSHEQCPEQLTPSLMAAPAAGSDRAQGCVKIKSYNRIIGPNISRPRIYGRGSTRRDLSHKTIYNTHSDTEKTFTGELWKKRKLGDGNFGN